MHMILRLKSDATHKAATSGDLIPEDHEEVMSAATDLATITGQTMDAIVSDKKRFKKADLTFFIQGQVEKEQKMAAAFAKAMMGISPSFGKDVDRILGTEIFDLYQGAIDELKGKQPPGGP